MTKQASTIHRVLAVSCSADPVLHHITPLGLAAALPTALVVDLDPDAPSYPARSLADLLDDGVRGSDLRPSRRGVAVVANGDVDPADAEGLVTTLAEGWPALVVRIAPGARSAWPALEVKPMLPGPLAPRVSGPAAYQRLHPGTPLPGPGLGLPPLSRAVAHSLLMGRVEPRWRWVRAWRRAWELPWR